MKESKANKVMVNMVWRFMERCGAQGVSLIVSFVLARLLSPSDYGMIALVTVFTSLLQVFVDSGLGTSLVQKKDADDMDFSTVFYFNICMCLVLYAVMFFAAPAIARFYEIPKLTAVVRVLCLMLIISGVRGIQHSYISRTMQFKLYFFATLAGTIVSAVVGIVMAYLGFGVWALVAQNLLSLFIGTIILWWTTKWRPRWMFSFDRLKGLFSYGWKILVSSLLDTGYIELRQLLIGKLYTTDDLAFYNKGQQLPRYATTNLNTTIKSVLLPAMANEQDNIQTVKAMTRRAIQLGTYIIMPMMVGLAVCAEPLIRLLLTETWLPCVFYLQIYCVIYAFQPIHTANLNAIKAMGRSDLFLKLEMIKKGIGLIVLLITLPISVEAMAYSLLATTITSQIINAWPNKKLLNYSYFEQVKDMLPQIGLSVLMGAVVYCVSFLKLSPALTLLIQVPLGVVIYVVGSKLFKIESYAYLLTVLKNLLQARKGKKA